MEAEILTEVLTAFRRISLDVTIAKIADLTAGTVKIIGPEGSDFILIDATEIMPTSSRVTSLIENRAFGYPPQET